MRCATCGFESPEGFRFCGACGAALPRSAGAEAVSEVERRQITVLFCDLAESTLLSARLDPEELRDVVRRYQAACAETIERHDGHVAQYLGDGLLAYFGWPEAHEDDPRRAMRAALGIVAAVEAVGESVARELGVELAVRVGLHSGPVVAGEVGAGDHRERLALGLTPNVAARVQVYAEPNSVVLSRATWQLVHGFFECEPLGERRMKGLTAPVEIFRALRETGARTRFEIALRSGLPPAVGREGEAALLLERFEQAREGAGQVVLVRGDPGIGKSRLVHLLRERTLEEQPLWLVCGCAEVSRASPFRPLVDLAHEVFGFEPEDSGEARRKKLEAGLAPYGELAEIIPLFCDFLSLPLGSGYAPLGVTPHLLKTRAMERLGAILLALARQRPVIFVMEDLHWADPSSLEFLRLLVDRVADERLLVLLTYRPGFVPDWPATPYQAALELDRLEDPDVERMIDGLTQGHRLPERIRRQILSRAEGVPLFVEEFTKMVVEAGCLGDGDGARERLPAAIPATLQELLTARLDRLGTAKGVAHLAALLGREFHNDLLRAVASEDGERLRRDLDRLVEANILFVRGEPPQESYVFKHALVQDAAIGSLLRSQRQGGHRRIAETLIERFPEIAESQPERVAHHWSEAGLVEPAVAHWLKAGTRALQRSANLEALEHLGRGLALLDGLPESGWRHGQELALCSALGRAHSAVKGYAAPEVERAYSRALELCHGIGETPDLFWTLWGLHTYYTMRAELVTAGELATRMTRLARSPEDPALTTAHYGLAVVSFFMGDAATAREHAERALALDAPQRDRLHPSVAHTVLDAGVVTRTLLGIVRAYRGEAEAAVASGREALALAERLAHPYSRACALNESAWIHLMLRDPGHTLRLAEEAIALCDERGFLLWSVVDQFVAGWAEAHGARGRAEARAGVERMRRHLDAYRAFGCRLSLSNWLSLFAEACVLHGLGEDARRALDEARAAVAAAGERGYEAEIERTEGELALLAAAGGVGGEAAQAEAEEHFRRALALARARGAGSFELRAAQRLARLLGERGQRREAAQTLGEVVGRLRDDSAWPELREARAFLQALA